MRAWSRTPRLVPTNVELKVGREDDEVKFSWVLRSSVERIDDHSFPLSPFLVISYSSLLPTCNFKRRRIASVYFNKSVFPKITT